MGSLQQIYAFNGQTAPLTLAKKGLMFVSATIKSKKVRAMLDTGAMHNFISTDEAKRLGLSIINGEAVIEAVIEAVNSPAQRIAGITKVVTVHFGPWSGNVYQPSGRLAQAKVSVARLEEKPSSPTSSKNNMPNEGVQKKRRRACDGKQRSKIIEGVQYSYGVVMTSVHDGFITLTIKFLHFFVAKSLQSRVLSALQSASSMPSWLF
ncbi:hypothetical protein EZV62_021826 [Acer yangbiense]|uniref:Aspartic peptidase DDI1-type domain-containing protein n=1 Tax=Acer yangbiense TaxID=1000413 RepID=A0A5C7H6T5_9ROSI|nr:hypothetical protein EZV62_021826 [Acer yangbiense]